MLAVSRSAAPKRARPAPAPARRLSAVAVLGVVLLTSGLLSGCGKSVPTASQSFTELPKSGAGPAAGGGVDTLSTKNTTRLGGADPTVDAAAVSLAVYPGLTPSSRPQAVVLVDEHDWPAALAASVLAAAPLRAPILYSDGEALPGVTAQALAALHPTGAASLGGAQVIEIGTRASLPGYRVDVLPVIPSPASSTSTSSSTASTTPVPAPPESAPTLAAIEHLAQKASGKRPTAVIVLEAEGSSAFTMPAAALSAQTGAPILEIAANTVPPATKATLLALHAPSIYTVGPAGATGSEVLAMLARLGSVKPIRASNPIENAIAISRYSDGGFGWGIHEPGHGLVFANVSRPLDAPAGALLSASGDYGPLLLLERPDALPGALTRYLSDIQPGYSEAPAYRAVHGVYNHGWLLGGEHAISARVQAQIDSALEISLRGSSSTTTSTTPTSTTPEHTTLPLPESTTSTTTSTP